jgi:hypothetical protein
MTHSRLIALIASITGILVVLLGTHAAAQTPVRPAAQVLPRLQLLYISDFRNEVGLTDEQFTKVVPLLQRFIQGRFANAVNRQGLTERLNVMLEGNPSEQEVQLINKQLAQVTRAKVNLENRFLTEIDPELTPVQQLKVRAFQENFEQWLLKRVELARSIVEQQQQNKQTVRPGQEGSQPAGPR